METISIGKEFLEEFEAEIAATRKCLERIPETLYEFKPHPTSMAMGYLTLLVAEIPKWITLEIQDSDLDFATYSHFEPNTTADLMGHFEENVEGARKALKKVTNEELQEDFSLKNNGKVMYSAPKKIHVRSTLNHWVHHRGQLTVYMRMNDIAVPSIYGPSADDNRF